MDYGDFTASGVYGFPPMMPQQGIAAPTQHMATDDLKGGLKGLTDPHNPLTWAFVILLVTVGAAGIAGSARIGKAKASLALDRA